jgi:hypothetical protein
MPDIASASGYLELALFAFKHAQTPRAFIPPNRPRYICKVE